MHGCGDGYSLGPSQFQHALDILAEEWRFDREILGTEPVDQLGQFLVDQTQSFESVFPHRQFERSHFNQGDPVAGTQYQAITHHYRARIDAQNYFRLLLQ